MEQQIIPPSHITETVELTWGLERIVGGCRACGQAYLISKSWIGQICPHCINGRLEEQPAVVRQEPPELLILFQLNKARLQNIYTQFTRGLWLAPDDFNPNHLLQRAMPVFWPMWLVDSDVKGVWQAEMGFDYQVKSSVEAYQAGQWNTQQRIETRIRWETRIGTLERHYDNIAVPALEEHAKMSSLLGDYALEQAKTYQIEDLGNALIWLPDLSPENSWEIAQKAIQQAAGNECQKAAEAQHARNFSIQAEYSNQRWSQMLLPMIVSYYHGDDGKVYPVWINGQNGQIRGIRAASQRKGWIWAGVSSGIALALFIAGLLLTAIPPITVLGAILIVLAFCIGVFAIIPAVWPWQWNRKQR
ncbi:MAG: hypothetical protein HPY59_12100 [Anaerolineae bacterium]|nr:hypothetical protein [Anaerolineae bacterium]